MEEKDKVVFNEKPMLRRPFVVCGLTGWVDGGEVATGSVKYIIKQLKARKFAEMPAPHYHIYQIPGADSLRPMVRMEEGVIVEHHLPKNQFFYARLPNSEHDIILFLGTEPAMNWEDYATSIVDVAKEFNAERLYVLGGVLDKTPHTREPRVSSSCTGEAVREEIRKYNVTFSNREGPTTFNTTLLYYCIERGLEGVSFSVRSTYYPEFNVVIPYNPKSIRALLVRLKHLMRIDLPLEWLDDGIRDFESKLEFMRKQSPKFNTYVEELEKDYIEMPFEEPLDMSGDEAVKLAEDILKRNREQH
jgi:proteasome assembly chaperone (PAC2) family protein